MDKPTRELALAEMQQLGGRSDTFDSGSGPPWSPGRERAFKIPDSPTTRHTTEVLGTQVGGSHYTDLAIQPIEYIWANGIGFSEGSVIKYVSRWKSKGGVKDLEKAHHHLALLIEREKAKLNA
jgi:hypothetical protein